VQRATKLMNILVSLAVATLLVMGLIKLFPTLFSIREKRTRDVISRISTEAGDPFAEVSKSALRSDALSDNEALDAALRKLPGIEKTHKRFQNAGMTGSVAGFLLVLVCVGVVLLFIFKLLHWPMTIAIPLAFGGAFWGGQKYLLMRREKRNLNFLNNFPEAVDMIVRSVRSGHPVSSALGMIAENMEDPIGSEFRQVVNEMAYGKPMTEALLALSERVKEQDVRFFVVVLNVQQETGGNLGEVLTNLSGILRKRKQMRLKIHALTSEGRMTAYILGALPLFVLGILQIVSPRYLEPLFEFRIGNFILGLAMAMILSAFLIVRKMIKIDV
jgi:tight adherence protein B